MYYDTPADLIAALLYAACFGAVVMALFVGRRMLRLERERDHYRDRYLRAVYPDLVIPVTTRKEGVRQEGA